MPRIRFTDRSARTLKPRRREATTRYWDEDCTGLRALVGTRTVSFYAQAGGKMFRVGRYPEWAIHEARERAKEIRRAVDAGLDPNPKPAAPTITLRKAFDLFQAARLSTFER